MKVGDRVRVRLSPHLEGERWRTDSWLENHWWLTGTVVGIWPGTPPVPWPVMVELLGVTIEPPFPYSRDELEVL